MCLRALLIFTGASLAAAQTAGSARLPVFRQHSIVLDYEHLKYNPANDVIIPSVVRSDVITGNRLGRYYMYYAPHDAPGGICLAYADKLEGPWKEYDGNPLIGKTWDPHYAVSHVSGPHVIWNEEERKLFLYYHGENHQTRLATTTDGIHFNYEGVVAGTAMFDDVSEASYARVFRYSLPETGSRYIMLLMGNNKGTRRIYLAWSKDGRKWTSRRTPLLSPPTGAGQVAQAWHLPWRGKLYLVYHAHLLSDPTFADLHVSEVDPLFEHTRYVGLFYGRSSFAADNVAAMSPCFIEEQGKLYMFFNVGPRLHQKIALAVADLK